MAEAVVQFEDAVKDDAGNRYVARVYRGQQPGGLWEAWFVFFPIGGGRALSTDRETTQSSAKQVEYWSTGITYAYLEGALARARRNTPEAKLARRAQWLERAEAVAAEEAATYERAAAHALAQAAKAARERETHDEARAFEVAAARARRIADDAERRRIDLEERARND